MLTARDRVEILPSVQRRSAPDRAAQIALLDLQDSDMRDNQNYNESPDNSDGKVSSAPAHLDPRSPALRECAYATAPRAPRRFRHSAHENKDSQHSCLT